VDISKGVDGLRSDAKNPLGFGIPFQKIREFMRETP
jgi:hypothetical protein